MGDSNRLTALSVKGLQMPGKYPDGRGLYLQVSKWNTKAWLFRYDRNGKSRWMGLGSVDDVSLAEARDARDEVRKLLRAGVDPIQLRRDQRMAAKAERARQVTFKACAEAYIKAHSAGWKNDVHRAQWKSTLERYAYPVIGELPVADVDTALVLKVIEPIWSNKTETAARLRGRIELVLDWAAAREYRRGENPARWRGHLDKLLPARTKVRRVKHHAALPYRDVPAFMANLRGRAAALPPSYTINRDGTPHRLKCRTNSICAWMKNRAQVNRLIDPGTGGRQATDEADVDFQVLFHDAPATQKMRSGPRRAIGQPSLPAIRQAILTTFAQRSPDWLSHRRRSLLFRNLPR